MNATILCAHCRKPQPDGGKRQTCIKCGTFPLPSFAYDKASSFHPDNCDGAPRAARKVQPSDRPSALDHINKIRS